MSIELIYTLLSSATGIFAGLWFCLGSVLSRAEDIAEISKSYWDYHKAHADAVVAQSAQYSIGAPLLVFAFVFQVLASTSNTNTQIVLPKLISDPFVFLLVVAIPIGSLSWGCYKLLLATKGKKVHKILTDSVNGE